MSVWGGPEGLADGMWRGIDAILRDRAMKQSQKQWDAAFAQRQQAMDNAQANADRTFAAQREDAATAQANADRTFAAQREDAATAQANADRAFQHGERKLDMAQKSADREFGLKQDEMALKTDLANAELDIKREQQDWSNQLNAERLRQFALANNAMDLEWQKKQEVEAAQKESGRRQLALALYRATGNGGQKQKIVVNGKNGKPTEIDANVLPQEQMRQIFGKDGYFRDVQNVVSFKDENGKTVAALVKPDGTMQTFDENALYDIYNAGVGKEFADGALKGVADQRDLGLFAAKEEAKATAHAKAVMMSDQYGEKRRIDAATAILKADDASDEDRANALAYLGTVFAKAKSAPYDELAKLKEEQAKRERKRITNPSANPYLTRSGK